MASDDVDNFLTHLSRKRARDEEENRKTMSIILGTITSVIAIVVAWYNENYLVKEPSRDWDQERRCYLNCLYNGREVDCIEQLRVSKNAFKSLCTILHGKGGLIPTRNVSIEESVAIFLNILVHNLKFRVIGFDYYRSKETISRQFNSALRAMMRISQDYLKLHPSALSGSESDKWKWFENCIGALDGTHIPVTVSVEERPRYQNRKGDISTNVLGVCDPVKRGTPNVLTDSVVKMASSFEQFINATTQKLDPLEVYNEVNAITYLSPDEQLKACTWFIENEKQFLMLKTLPVERKKGMVLMFISPRA